MYDDVMRVIEAGGYDLADLLRRIDVLYVDGRLTDDERASMASLAASDPLIINGKIYVVSSSAVYETEPPYAATKSLARLTVINAATGAREREVTLARTLDSVCRPVYADGILVIPLAEGYLQAVSAATLETLWVVDGTAGAQSISSLTVSDGYVYIATADALGANYLATAGSIRRVNLYTGALAGATVNETAGYYWAGGIMHNGFYLVGDDAGVVHVFAADLSHEVASVSLGSSVRSTLVAHEGSVYAVTTDGVLHKLSVASDGAAAEVARVGFAASSTHRLLHGCARGDRPCLHVARGCGEHLYRRHGCRGGASGRREERAACIGAGCGHLRLLHLQQSAWRPLLLQAGRLRRVHALHAGHGRSKLFHDLGLCWTGWHAVLH